MLKHQGPEEDRAEGKRLPRRSSSRSELGEWTHGEGGIFSKEGTEGGEGESFHGQNINHLQRESPAPQSHKQFPGEVGFKEGREVLQWKERERERKQRREPRIRVSGLGSEKGWDHGEQKREGIKLILPDRSGDRGCRIGTRKWQDHAFGSKAIASTLSLGHCAGIRGRESLTACHPLPREPSTEPPKL